MAKKILLADDSLTIQKVIELTFPSDRFEVVSFSNGKDALDKLDAVRPDIVLADVVMPSIDGYEVCRQVKARYPGTPVVLLTGTFEPFDEQKAQDAGADANVIKPFDSSALVQKVDELLASYGEAQPQPEVSGVPEEAPAEPAYEPPVVPPAPGQPSFSFEEPSPAPVPGEEPAEELFDTGAPSAPVQEEGPLSDTVPEAPVPGDVLAEEPLFDVPSEPAGASEAPFAEELIPQEAVSSAPLNEVPAEEPAYEAPAEETAEAPSWDAPVPETPAEEPAYEAPAEEAAEAPSWDAPVPEAPAEEPSYEAPAEEAAEAPSWDAPVPETPVEEPRYDMPAEEIESTPEDEVPPVSEPREEPFYEQGIEEEHPPEESVESEEDIPYGSDAGIQQEEEVEETPIEEDVTEVEAQPAVPSVSGPMDDAVMETIVQKVLERMTREVVEEIVWEVVPDLAETLIKKRIQEIEESTES